MRDSVPSGLVLVAAPLRPSCIRSPAATVARYRLRHCVSECRAPRGRGQGDVYRTASRSREFRWRGHRLAVTRYRIRQERLSRPAVDGKGKALTVTHPDPYSWTVTGHNGTVTLSYTDYANVGSGTFSGFNVENEHVQPQGSLSTSRDPRRGRSRSRSTARSVVDHRDAARTHEGSGNLHRARHAIPV